MFKHFGQVIGQEPLPVPAIMLKRLGQEASRKEAPVTAIVFTQPVPALMFTQPIRAKASRQPCRLVHGVAVVALPMVEHGAAS
jgi:hypothetical protein